jgi:hypothetical protein
MISNQKLEWENAMKDEISIMHERKVWTLTYLPDNVKPVGCRWVYTMKRDDLGNIVRYKARLVAQGFKQIKGDTYEETFSPVVNFSLIRFFFSLLVVGNGWKHIQCDVKCAYLYAPLKETIYMYQPLGFIEKGKENLFCKLNKAIYGLHQSGRVWFFEIDKVLNEIGFIKFEWCNCVYMFESNVILLLYVDDIVLFAKRETQLKRAISLLSERFDVKVLGKTRKLLGVEFEESESFRIHQQAYISEVCDRFKVFNFPISSLPITKGTVYSKLNCPQTDQEIEEMSKIPYRNLLGCLSFISNRTRPDISYAVNIFSQFQNNPGMAHWCGLLKLLGYVAYTKSLKLELACNKAHIITYTDADFATNRDDRTSLGGQLVLLGNSPIAWRTFKEKCVSLSTMEAEFVAMTEATKELLWFDRVLSECVQKNIINAKEKSVLYVDNQATINFVKSPIEHYSTKHIDVKLFFIRDLVYKDTFSVKYVRSQSNLADIFTKPLTRAELEKFRDCIFAK